MFKIVQKRLNDDGKGFDGVDSGEKHDEELPDSIETYLEKTNQDDKLRLLRSFLDRDNLPAKTDLTEKQIEGIVTMTQIDHYLQKRKGITIYKQYYEDFMELQLSKNRKSRKEIVEMFKNGSDRDLEELENEAEI